MSATILANHTATAQAMPRRPVSRRSLALRTTLPGMFLLGLLPLLIALSACAQSDNQSAATAQATAVAAPSPPAPSSSVAIFAGGCFWCMEPPYDKLAGVLSTTSGYTGGTVANPSYEQVSAGGTGHAEAVQVKYDPRQVSYAKLLEVFWHNIDPVAVDRQFCDIGDQYRSAIFTIGADQQRLAEASKRTLEASGRFEHPIATQVVAATTFYPAESYHQDYYEKNPIRYKYYRFGCGRDGRLDELWGSGS